MNWTPTSERLPEVCEPVIGYSDKWVDVEYNPKGIRECFRNDDEWQSAKWNNYQDCWDVDIGAPDYWMSQPECPSLPPLPAQSEEEFELITPLNAVSFLPKLPTDQYRHKIPPIGEPNEWRPCGPSANQMDFYFDAFEYRRLAARTKGGNK